MSTHRHYRPRRRGGFSLIEIMVALAIGTVILLGITTLFINTSSSKKEMEKAGELIEGGRYAVDLLHNDIRHAGFLGPFTGLLEAPNALPDPCSITLANLQAAMGLHIQGYRAAALNERPNLSGTTCATSLLSNANLQPGSDIVVVRRLDTGAFDVIDYRNLISDEITASTPSQAELESFAQENLESTAFTLDVDGATMTINPVDDFVYLQGNAGGQFEILQGDSAADLLTFTTGGVTTVAPYKSVDDTDVTVFKMDGISPAEIRRVYIHIYFVAPCSVGSGTDGVCQNGDDTTPTLKRLVLSRDGSNPKFVIEPLVEGIEYLKVEYGIDNSPTDYYQPTGSVGDGVPDLYLPNSTTTTTNPSLTQWPAVVSARIYLLARPSRTSPGYSDTKLYTLGAFTSSGVTQTSAANDGFRRHVFSSEARLNNIAGRRERP